MLKYGVLRDAAAPSLGGVQEVIVDIDVHHRGDVGHDMISLNSLSSSSKDGQVHPPSGTHSQRWLLALGGTSLRHDRASCPTFCTCEPREPRCQYLTCR